MNRAPRSRSHRYPVAAMGLVCALLVGLPAPSRATTSTTSSTAEELAEAELDLIADQLGMSPAEVATHLDQGDLLGSVREVAQTVSSSEFGGIWIDREAKIHVAFTEHAADRTTQILDQIPAAKSLIPETVDLSAAELDSLASAIWDARQELTSLGVRIERLTILERTNAVEVAVDSNVAHARSVIADRFGDGGVLVVEGTAPELAQAVEACTSRFDCVPLRGATDLLTVDSSGAAIYECSSGFSGRYGTQAAMITAGHCGRNGSSFVHSADLVGQGRNKRFTGTTDALVIPITNPVLTNRPLIYQRTNPTVNNYRIIGMRSTSYDAVGQIICHSGLTTNVRCGHIGSLDARYTLEDEFGATGDFNHIRVDDTCSLPGDSGGPIYASQRARGILSASNFINDSQGGQPRCSSVPRTYWSAIGNVLPRVNATLIYSS